MRITRITVVQESLPAAKAGRVSLTEPARKPAERIAVSVETDAGVTGSGFTLVNGTGT